MRLAPAATALALLTPDDHRLPPSPDDSPPTWPLPVACAAKMHSPNARLHHRAEAALIKEWRESAFHAAQVAKLPKRLTRVRIDALIRPTRQFRKADRANLVDRVKPCVDGLGPPFVRLGKRPVAAVGWELMVNDDDEHLDGPYVEVGPTVGKGELHRIDLLITDLSGLATHRTWAPEQVAPDGPTRIVVRRTCNGCGARVGDVLPEEVAARFADLPLPDVRDECRWCREVAG